MIQVINEKVGQHGFHEQEMHLGTTGIDGGCLVAHFSALQAYFLRKPDKNHFIPWAIVSICCHHPEYTLKQL